MAEIPERKHTIAAKIDSAHELHQEKPRPHLGASIAGHHCDRWIWLSFRWAVVEQFPGRILRLFRRGQLEEDLIVADLKQVGVKVTDQQKRVGWGGHVSGSIDGVGEGVPGAERTPHLLEFKTHSKKSFADLEKNGVEKSKPQHWAQMQLYMHGLGLKRALYYAVCKDDDHIYTERVKYDEAAAQAILSRAESISLVERMPDGVSADPSWWQCKFCPAHDFCHGSKMTQQVNCRTCAHATPEQDGTWSCARWESNGIPTEYQHGGCPSHVLHPDLVPWERKASADPHEAVYVINGVDVRNGEGDAYTFSSGEILANPAGCADPMARKVKEEFNGEARIVG